MDVAVGGSAILFIKFVGHLIAAKLLFGGLGETNLTLSVFYWYISDIGEQHERRPSPKSKYDASLEKGGRTQRQALLRP